MTTTEDKSKRSTKRKKKKKKAKKGAPYFIAYEGQRPDSPKAPRSHGLLSSPLLQCDVCEGCPLVLDLMPLPNQAAAHMRPNASTYTTTTTHSHHNNHTPHTRTQRLPTAERQSSAGPGRGRVSAYAHAFTTAASTPLRGQGSWHTKGSIHRRAGATPLVARLPLCVASSRAGQKDQISLYCKQRHNSHRPFLHIPTPRQQSQGYCKQQHHLAMAGLDVMNWTGWCGHVTSFRSTSSACCIAFLCLIFLSMPAMQPLPWYPRGTSSLPFSPN